MEAIEKVIALAHVEIPTDDTEARRLLRDLRDTVRIGDSTLYDPRHDRLRERVACACDVAAMLGGESLRSLIRCMQRIAASYAIVSVDGCMLSFCFEGRGLFGGVIFHATDRTWSMHT